LVQDLNTESIVESLEILSFLSGFSPKSDPIEYSINENLIDQRTWVPRVCGTVLFHTNPPAVMPIRCGAKVARYETREDEPEREHLKESFSFEKPIYPLITETVEKVRTILSSITIWTAEGLKQVEYPPEALWEVIVNAFIHRDYSLSDDVTILIYNDRVEVKSPGRLPGYVTPENILDVRFSRNPKIVRTLSRYRNAPNKDLGEGLNTAFQQMKDWRLKPPIIVEQNNYVVVTLPHTPLAAPTELILDFLKEHNEITNRQAREITGIKSENLVKVEFYKLRNADMLEMVPGKRGPAAAWRLKK
jgi:ATP-dependent DNA helicase RecG